MQAVDGVRPPRDGHFSPFGEQRRVVIFFFGGLANPIGKGQRGSKSLELIYALQPRLAFFVDHCPVRHILVVAFDLRGSQGRGFLIAGYTFFSG